MSHEATNWAIKTKGLRPITKIVLWHLADCHNPSAGCFPTQEYLAAQCEISRASINRQLDLLEAEGFIRRHSRVDPETKRQLPTRYRLAFEEGFEPQDIVSRVSEIDTDLEGEPCLTDDESRVSENDVSVSHSSETLTSKGTGNSTSKKKEAHTRSGLTDGFVLVGGKVRLHMDDPMFREIVRLRKNKHPPTDRDGYWLFPPDEAAAAQKQLTRHSIQAAA